MAIQVEVWGDYALFSRPEFKVEHVSYDTMTPSAARGCWKVFTGTPVCDGASTAFMYAAPFASPTFAATR